MLTQEEKLKIANKFFNDPDWAIVEKMLEGYLEPLTDIMAIDIKDRSADSVMAELAGKQITLKQLTEFLRDCRILGSKINSKPISFK